jgi:phosphoglycerate dehydrogenase-like enzyme
VTDLEYRKAADIFKNAAGFECIPAPSDESGLSTAIRAADAKSAIVGVTQYCGELYDAIPAGGVIARFGVGHDGINKTLAKSKGILCCNTPGVLDDSVAECTMGLMLSCARHIAACAAETRDGKWTPRLGSELSGKILAIIGYGNIGCKVAKIAKKGFGMKIIGFDVEKPKNMGEIDEFTNDFAIAVENADFVSLHIPCLPSTRNFMNLDRLKMMKSSAILINTSRGGVLDEDALYDAVKFGTISGAGLDVFKSEPYCPQCPEKDLRTLDGIIMTPHIGSSTIEASNRMAKAALRNIELAIHGKIKEMDLIIQ